jgi:hypothetical protein
MRLPLLRAFAVAFVATHSFLFPPRSALAADPTTADCLAASEASLKAANVHHLRAERGYLLICAASSCPGDIRKECLRRVDEVNADIPTMVFSARDGSSGNELSAVKVTMDGEVLAERLEGTAVSIDPGEHTFTFETPGQTTLTKQFLVQQAQKDRRETIVFGAPPSTTVATGVTSSPLPGTPPPAGRNGGLGTQRALAIAAWGIGLAGIGVGAAFGLVAMSDKNDAQNQCPNSCATQAGVDAWHKAGTAATASTIGFVAGGVGVVGGLLLWFTAPRTNTQLAIGPTELQLRGTW